MESPFHLYLLSAPQLPASLSLRLCSLTRSCHGLELWNTSLREVSAWKKTAEGLDGPSLERLLLPSLDTDVMGRSQAGAYPWR